MRYIVLLLVLLVGAGFVFINWPAVNAPAEVNLLITTAKAPITLMLLFWFSLLFRDRDLHLVCPANRIVCHNAPPDKRTPGTAQACNGSGSFPTDRC